MRPLLDFDDAGATDDHLAKGVTIGDIRAWHDEMERLRLAATLDDLFTEEQMARFRAYGAFYKETMETP